ncbi:MAG: outer membrane lipoprotein chaperone LolA [Rhodocyclaceae bacterium]|jgi:outer membrane lipoprotein carrier protein|nr:outer membrane lipoprotein chaperone LolA [Rhodocyclaceae bacterium]
MNLLPALRPTFAASLLLLVFTFSTAASAQNAIDQFRTFVQSTKSARADFSQVVTDNRGKAGPASIGTLQFERPGKFRWVYEKPAQIIVGDGKKVWFFDQDLNQVSVRPLEAAFSSTPAALLAGRAEIDAAFTLVAGAESEGMAWVIAEPKTKDAGIEKIRLGFQGVDLRLMELSDAFGNKTRITLSRFERNPRLDAKQFTFVPPKGADVVGQ